MQQLENKINYIFNSKNFLDLDETLKSYPSVSGNFPVKTKKNIILNIFNSGRRVNTHFFRKFSF